MKTKIKKIEYTNNLEDAANRLIARGYPGYFGSRAVGWDIPEDDTVFSAEVVRAVGGLTEHTGIRVHFTRDNDTLSMEG